MTNCTRYLFRYIISVSVVCYYSSESAGIYLRFYSSKSIIKLTLKGNLITAQHAHLEHVA
jgi:hypothetical protein